MCAMPISVGKSPGYTNLMRVDSLSMVLTMMEEYAALMYITLHGLMNDTFFE